MAERSAELQLPVQIHLSETEDEVKGCEAEHGERPAFYLDRVGMLGPHTVLAHGCWLDHAELELIADRGATVVTNPVANLKLAVGRVFPYLDAREVGVEVGLGTDGPGSNNSLDLLSDAKTFALLQKNEARDPAAVTATESLAIATGRRSGLLGGQGLVVGAPADFLLVARRRSRALAGRARRGARLRRLRLDRRHHGRGGQGADARGRGRGRRRGRRPGSRAGRRARHPLINPRR